ncbi:MAG: ATP-binding protein [Euryarchaeota archaeon]|nr:MAG: DNA double-strand break repair helicase HerA [ANME-2 cluster archaeon]MEA1865141.1 ATP-binding protein [Euryarchaeota archaeon]
MPIDSIGTIFGETGFADFRFVVSDPSTKQGDYLKIWHETDGWTLAQVVAITKSNDDVTIESALDKRDDTGNDHVVAKAIVIGSRQNRVLRVPKTPFSPGDRVFRADSELIAGSLGLTRGDVYLGLLEGQEIPVHLDANTLVQKHVSILARTGSGKSYAAGVIMEELLVQGIPLLIIDPHGEYTSLKDPAVEGDFERFGVSPSGYAENITVYTPADRVLNPGADLVFRLNGVNLKAGDLAKVLNIQSGTQMGVIYEAIQKIRAEKSEYTIDDIIFEVGNSSGNAKWGVLSILESIREAEIFSDDPTPIQGLIQPGRGSIIDMKGVVPDMQTMIVARLCEELFEARKVDLIPPMMLIIEEAHNYCPEKGFGKTASTDILRTIASEGRKFGLGMMVVTQRPARIDKNILSQCNTQIILKVTNPNDLQAIRKGLEGISVEAEDEVKRLPPGVAMVVSGDIERPIIVEIRARRSRHGGASVSVIEHAEPMVEPAEPVAEPVPVARQMTESVTRPLAKLMTAIAPEKRVESGVPVASTDDGTDAGHETTQKKKPDSLLTKFFGSSTHERQQ